MMHSAAQLLLLLVVLTDFAVLGTSRLSACIRWIAFQGALLGLLSFVAGGEFVWNAIILAAGTIVVKAIVLPAFLRWAIREAAIRREIEPKVGYLASILLGGAALAVAFGVAASMPASVRDALVVPVALVTLITGMIVLMTRVKAITQVIGYLMLENGVYLFGIRVARQVPFLIEAGVLLDVFVGVFIMGIVVFHINREFDSISSANLSELRDS
jgi:hydrogenase-4 component E